MAKKMTPKKTTRSKRVQELAIRVKGRQAGGKKESTAIQKKTPQKIGIKFYEAGSEGIKENSGFITEAYNAQLFFPGVQPLYSRLRRSMPEMVMIRNAFTAWARGVRPIVELPDDPNDDDKAYQDFIENDFDNMQGGFAGFVDTLVNQVPFMGWGWWEAVPSIRDPKWNPPGESDWRSEADDGLIGLRNLAWRDSSTFDGWFMEEPRKKLKGLYQQDWPNPRVLLLLKNSLHITFGDPNNPEGLSPLEAVWRKERMKFGYEVVHGIGSEHAAGHLSVKKDQEGVLSDPDKASIETTANNLMSAQEGNYAYWPFGLTGEIIDVPFSAAGSLLDMIKHLSIEMLALYNQQWIALNTMTNTGAQASQVDSTDSGVFFFNSMMDGFAEQYDQQIGKRLYGWNRYAFPGMTKRPKIKFSHIDRAIALNDLANFVRTLDGILPMTDDDFKEIRRRSGVLPVNVDVIAQAKAARAMDAKAKAAADAKAAKGAGAVDPNAKGNAPKGKQGTNLSELGGAGSGNEGHAGRPGLVGGSKKTSSKDAGENKVIGTIKHYENAGAKIYLVEDAKDIEKNFSTMAICVRGEDKGDIIASKTNLSHNQMLSNVDRSVDSYVRFVSYWDNEKGIDGLMSYDSSAAVSDWKEGWVAKAIDNIYMAGEIMVEKGADPKTLLSIQETDSQKTIETTLADFQMREKFIAEFGGTGSGFYGHAGRDEENLRGGSKPSGNAKHSKIAPKDAGLLKKVLAKTDPNKNEYPGISVNVKTGEEPTTGYALSLHPDKTQREKKWTTMSRNHKKEALRKFISENQGMLNEPGNNLGMWLQLDKSKEDYGFMYIDISVVVQDRETAWKMSNAANQLAMWDIANGAEIDTGGTGEKLLPPN